MKGATLYERMIRRVCKESFFEKSSLGMRLARGLSILVVGFIAHSAALILLSYYGNEGIPSWETFFTYFGIIFFPLITIFFSFQSVFILFLLLLIFYKAKTLKGKARYAVFLLGWLLWVAVGAYSAWMIDGAPLPSCLLFEILCTPS